MLGYLDPGSGAVVVQAVAGGIAGVFVVIKMFGHRIADTLFFWRSAEEPGPDDADGASTDPEDPVVESDGVAVGAD